MLLLSFKFDELALNPYKVIVSLSSSGTNHVINECEDLGQDGPYVVPFQTMSCYSHPSGLVAICSMD